MEIPMKLRHLILGGAIAALAAACGSTRDEDAASSASAGGASAARGGVAMQQYQTRQQAFQRLDANNSGAISRTEAQASPPLMVIFVEVDANSDGELSAAEWGEVPLVNPDGTRVP
jgi:hypothetical protein